MTENEKLRALLAEARESFASGESCAEARSTGCDGSAERYAREARHLHARIDAALAAPPEQEETEHAMHLRIRAGYDKTIADCWRAKVADVEKERDEARAEIASLRNQLEMVRAINDTQRVLLEEKNACPTNP